MAISEYMRTYEAPDDLLPITRVMDDWKFSSLISTKTLYFSPASEFIDELEGTLTHQDHRNADQLHESWGFDNEAIQTAADARRLVSTHNQPTVVISCWTMLSEITNQMWGEYTKSEDSLAIHTTVGKLKSTLGNKFLIGPVKYLDFDKQTIPKRESLEPFFYKQDTYQWENEVRILANMELKKKIGTPREAPITSLDTLITKVTFHPKATRTYIEKVTGLLKQYSLDHKL